MTRPITAETVKGIHAAVVCPLTPDFAVDEAALAAMLDRLMRVPGIAGVMVNGHAGENVAMGREDKRRVVAVAAEAMAGRGVLIAGINAENSLEAAAQARDAEAEGAEVAMVFGPNGGALGQPKGAAVTHHRIVGEATGLPLMLFQASVRAGAMAYAPDVLAELVAMPAVIGIKEGSWDSAAYDATRRLAKGLRPEVAVMASGDEHLWASFIFGSEGSVVSLATLIPEPIVALDRAVKAGDGAAAAAAHAVIYPLAKAIYGRAPGSLATARLKTAMRLAGQLGCDACLPPVGPIGADEVAALAAALRDAGVPVSR